MSDAALPSAAPLDLDALLSEFYKEVALEALESVANPRVDVARAKIIEAFAAARRGVEDTPVRDAGPRHVCGLMGYNGMIDPPCPACEERRLRWEATKAARAALPPEAP